MKKPALIRAAVLVLALLTPSLAAAEGFSDIYIGSASSSSDDIQITVAGTTSGDISSEGSTVIIGARAGFWVEDSPFGIAIDISYFEPSDILEILPISVLAMGRLKGATDTFQPYVAIGPAFFFSSVNADLRPGINDSFDDNQIDLGIDARLGVVWKLSEKSRWFAEYRFTSFEVEFKDSILGFSTTLSATVNTHHFNVGIRFQSEGHSLKKSYELASIGHRFNHSNSYAAKSSKFSKVYIEHLMDRQLVIREFGVDEPKAVELGKMRDTAFRTRVSIERVDL